jgi:hypothetical protein
MPPSPPPRARCAVAVTLAWLALLASGCALSATGELPDVEVVQHDVSFPAARLDGDGNDVAIAISFAQKPPRLGLPKAALAQVIVLGVGVTAKTGVTDLSFVHGMRLTLTSTEALAAGLPPIEIGRYQRVDGAEVGPMLLVPSDPPVDVAEVWRGTQVIFGAEVVGQLPTTAWTADVSFRFSARLEY